MFKRSQKIIASLQTAIGLIVPIVSLTLLTLLPALAASSSTNIVSAGIGHHFNEPVSYQMRQRFSQQQSQTVANAAGSNSVEYYYNWSGYADTTTASFNQVQSTFVQPAVSCPVPNAWTLFWVGFDGYSNGTVEQSGTAAQCGSSTSAAPTYYAWWEMYPTNNIQMMPITVQPGQTVQAVVSYNLTNGRYSLAVNNLSNRQSYTAVTTCARNLTCARQSAEWIIERPTVNGSFAPLADWSTTSLSSDEASNSTTYNRRTRVYSPVLEPLSYFSNNPINMVSTSAGENLLAVVSNVATNGTSFSDTWDSAE